VAEGGEDVGEGKGEECEGEICGGDAEEEEVVEKGAGVRLVEMVSICGSDGGREDALLG
jgi:hypothetical protein